MFRCFQYLVLLVGLAGLCVNSWGACYSGALYLQSAQNAKPCIGENNYSGCCEIAQPVSTCEYSGPNKVGDCPIRSGQWANPTNGPGGYYLAIPSADPLKCRTNSGCNALIPYCEYTTFCTTQAEADSVANSLNCDGPENWKCSTSSSIVKVQQASEDIICDSAFGGCYAGNGCAIYTEYQTSCKNQCSGDSTVQSYRTEPIWQDGFCDEVDIDRDDCGPTRCIDLDGYFALVHDCASNNVINGEIQMFPLVFNGGKGSCLANGYQPVNPDSVGNNGNSPNRDSILQALQDSLYSQNCLLFGQCGNLNDSTDFSLDSNRTPQNGCYCERLDDLPNVSRIVCPDGTSRIFYGSCNDWENRPSSSSSSPSQSSESGGGGSSVADPRPTDWANWSQANEMNEKLDANNGLLSSISMKLGNLFSWLTSSDLSVSRDTSSGLGSIDWDSPVFVDSSYLYDTTTYSVFNDVADSLFSLAQQNKGLIDTSSHADVSGCFTCRFAFTRALGGQSVEVNFGSLGGFNICRILRSLLIILAEIACLLMLFSSFIKGGKS